MQGAILTSKVERHENPPFTSHFTPKKTMEFLKWWYVCHRFFHHHHPRPKRKPTVSVFGKPPHLPDEKNLEVEVRSSTCSYCAARGMKPCDVDAGVVLWSNIIHAVCVNIWHVFLCRSVYLKKCSVYGIFVLIYVQIFLRIYEMNVWIFFAKGFRNASGRASNTCDSDFTCFGYVLHHLEALLAWLKQYVVLVFFGQWLRRFPSKTLFMINISVAHSPTKTTLK